VSLGEFEEGKGRIRKGRWVGVSPVIARTTNAMKEKGDPELRGNLNVHASRKGIIEPSIVCVCFDERAQLP
jgi:hypothetical protein